MATYLTLNLQTGETELKRPTYNQNIPHEIIETNDDGYIDLVLIPDEVKNVVYLPASETILAGKLVTYTEFGSVKTYGYGDTCIGIAFNLTNANQDCPVLTSGRFILQTNLEYSGPVYADPNGNISVYPYEIIQQIGYIVGNKLVLNIQIPIVQLDLGV